MPAPTARFPDRRVVTGYDFVGDAYNARHGPPLFRFPTTIRMTATAMARTSRASSAPTAARQGRGARGDLRCLPRVRLRRFDASRHHDRGHGARAADGMQVVNQSIGSARQWPQYPTAQAATRHGEQGHRDGRLDRQQRPRGSSPDALFAAGAPGVGDKVIGVGSFDNAQRAFTVDGTPYGYNQATGAPLPPTTGTLPMAKTGTPRPGNDALRRVARGQPGRQGRPHSPRHVLFLHQGHQRPGRRRRRRRAVQQRRGALTQRSPGTPADHDSRRRHHRSPRRDPGRPDRRWPDDADLDGRLRVLAVRHGRPDLGLQLVRPHGRTGAEAQRQRAGRRHLLDLPVELGGYTTLSGTSMSSPHVAGGVALVLEARPHIPSNAMLGRLQNSADPKNWSGNPALGFLDYSHRQGAGMLDIMGTVQATTVIEPSQLSLGESEVRAGHPHADCQQRRLVARDVQRDSRSGAGHRA